MSSKYILLPLPLFFFFLIFISIYLLDVPDLSCGLLNLVPQPGFEPEPAVLGAQSLHPWTTRHVPLHFLFLLLKFIWSGLLLPSKDLMNTWTAVIQNCWKMLSKFAKFLRILNLANSQTIGRARAISWQGNHRWIFLSWLWWVGLKSGYHRAHHLERRHGQSGILNKTKHCKDPYVTVKIPNFPPHESSAKRSTLNANQLGTALTPLCNSLNSTPQVEAKNKITACSAQIQDLICLCPASLRAQNDWSQTLDFCRFKLTGMTSVYSGLKITRKWATGWKEYSLYKLGPRWDSTLGVWWWGGVVNNCS